MTLKLAVFDVDGTLVDSRDIIQKAMSEAFTKWGFKAPDYEETRQIVGLSLYEALARLKPDADDKLLANMVEDYKNSFIAMRTQPGFFEPMYDGALELLKDMSADGWLMGVATGKSRRGLDTILDMHDLGDLFDTHWCADDGPGKPHPFMVQQNMDVLGCFAEQTLVIGDATFDMLMARAANAHAVGVSWGFGKVDELTQAGAHEVHHDFETLRAGVHAFSEKVTA